MKAINFKANVSEFGFFRRSAATRGRLIASVLVVTAIEFGLGLWSAHYILETSSSVIFNLLLITFNMMWALAASYLQSVLIGDLFFSGPWRERVILGKNVPGSVHDHNAEFMIVLVILLVANVVGINVASGGFFDIYENEGFFRAQLRSDDGADRLATLVELGDVTNFELWENPNLQKLVAKHIDDPDELVRERAAWTLGEMKATHYRDVLIDKVATDEVAAVRNEAAHALGKMGNHGDARIALEKALHAASQDDVKVALLRALALMQSPLSAQVAWKFTRGQSNDVSLYAYWVLRTGAEPSIRDELRTRLEAPLSDQERCALLDTLKMVATEDDTIWARKQFVTADAEAGCEPVIWEDLNERIYYVLYSDAFRVKYMKIVANGTGTAQKGWFERIVADPQQPWRVREVANEIVLQINKVKR